MTKVTTAALAEMKRKLQVLLQGYRKRERSLEARMIEEFLIAVDTWWKQGTDDPLATFPVPRFPPLVEAVEPGTSP